MTTYVYETVPQTPGEEPRYFEIQQSMKDRPLTRHPETGEPIRRVILGGSGCCG
jgi:predicted nucleic acid-binding Zn ribbon protein